MADISQNISLTTTGATEAAAAISTNAAALDNVTKASGGMQAQFQQRFQHIGLQMFAAQSLGAIGLSGETRQAVMLMNTALTGVEAAAGISSGGLTLLLTALVAVGMAVYEVIQKHTALIASLNATHAAQQKSIVTTDDAISSIKNYIEAGGQVTPILQKWLNAEEALRTAQINLQKATDLETISTLKSSIAKEEGAGHTLTIAQTYELLAGAILHTVGASQLSDAMVQKITSSVIEQNLSLAKNKAALAAIELEYNNLKNGVTSSLAAQTAATAGYTKNVEALYLEMNKRREDSTKAEDATERRIMDQHMSAFIDDQQEQVAAHDAAQDAMQKKAKAIGDVMGKDLGTAVADWVMKGESFTQSMQHLFEQMAEQFIEKVIMMAVEWAVLKAVMSIYPGGAAAYTTMSNAAYPAVAQGAYQGIGQGGAQAEGGTYRVDQPTMFMAGEAGPEIATFTPLSDINNPNAGGGGGGNVTSSSGGGSGPITVGDINVSLSLASLGTTDVNKMLQQLATAIRTSSADAIRFAVTSANLASKNATRAV